MSKASGGKFIDGVKGAAAGMAITAAVSWTIENWPIPDAVSSTTTENDASGSGNLDFSTEGTAADREALYKKTKSALNVDNITFDDRYAIRTVNSNGDVISTDYFTDAGKARAFAHSASVGTSRAWLHGRHVITANSILGFVYSRVSNITMYRSSMMGWS